MASGISALNKKEAAEEAAKRAKVAEEKANSSKKKAKKAGNAVSREVKPREDGAEEEQEEEEEQQEREEEQEQEPGSESEEEEEEEVPYNIGDYVALYAVEGAGYEAPFKAFSSKGKWEENMPLLVGVVHTLAEEFDVFHGRGGDDKKGVKLQVDEHTLGIKVSTQTSVSNTYIICPEHVFDVFGHNFGSPQ